MVGIKGSLTCMTWNIMLTEVEVTWTVVNTCSMDSRSGTKKGSYMYCLSSEWMRSRISWSWLTQLFCKSIGIAEVNSVPWRWICSNLYLSSRQVSKSENCRAVGSEPRKCINSLVAHAKLLVAEKVLRSRPRIWYMHEDLSDMQLKCQYGITDMGSCCMQL